MMRNERRARAELEARQLEALRTLIRHAYGHVRIYRELYDDAGVEPRDLRSLSDLRFLPTISKRDLQACEPADAIDDRIEDRRTLLSIKTSGSSGASLEFFIDSGHDQLRKAQYLRPYLSTGRRLRDRLLRFSSETTAPQSWFNKIGLMRERLIYADSDVAKHIDTIKAEQPDIIQGFGSELVLIAREILDTGLRVPSPRLIYTDSELLTGGFRKIIEQTFGVPVLDVYGTYEIGNVGYECTEHSGYHLAEDCVITEILDEAGRPVEPGMSGELVFTSLHNTTMPFIRYRIGDSASSSPTDCACGRTFKRMTGLQGRMTDFVRCEDGSLRSPTALIGAFDRLADRVREFQVVQQEIDSFEVRVVPKGTLDPDLEYALRAALTTEFPRAAVRVTAMASIPRSASRKYKAFVQECA